MAEKRVSRRKNLGFKPPGADPAHDTVYTVLENLPRGAASDFVVVAVMEFLQNHAGETVKGNKRSNLFVLPAAPETSIEPGPHKGGTGVDDNDDLKKNDKKKKAPCSTTKFNPSLEQSISPSTAVKDDEMLDAALEGEKSIENAREAQPSYTELDDDTLSGLVSGFGGFNFPQG